VNNILEDAGKEFRGIGSVSIKRPIRKGYIIGKAYFSNGHVGGSDQVKERSEVV
jgi:hypothetical protein